MSARNDSSRSTFVVAAALPASGTVLLGTDGNDAQPRPYSHAALLGYDRVSLTVQLASGTAVGTLTVQVTDFGGDYLECYGVPDAQWANTTSTVALAGAPATFNVNINGIGAKYLRLSYAATSGTGVLNVAITLRAVSQS